MAGVVTLVFWNAGKHNSPIVDTQLGPGQQSIIAVTVEGSVLGCAAILFGLYNFLLLEKVKDEHEELTLASDNGSGANASVA
ncbi:hypothetical protein V8F33_010457 [Rhypophila sp. PSN 637]